MRVEVSCPDCKCKFDINPASILATSKKRVMSERAVEACRTNARKPRPNAKGKARGRKHVKS